jgi:hypothetical protein
MSAVIDQKYGLALLERRLAETTNDRHRAVLNAVLKHAKLEAEPVWDLDQIMATLTPDPAYQIWVNGVDVGPKGGDAVRAFYTGTVSARTHFLEFDLERLVVDDHCAILEGFLKQIYPGVVAVAMGMADDANADYLMVFRALVVMPVNEDGLMEGEDAYTSGPASVTKLSPEELPPEYVTLARTSG